MILWNMGDTDYCSDCGACLVMEELALGEDGLLHCLACHPELFPNEENVVALGEVLSPEQMQDLDEVLADDPESLLEAIRDRVSRVQEERQALFDRLLEQGDAE